MQRGVWCARGNVLYIQRDSLHMPTENVWKGAGHSETPVRRLDQHFLCYLQANQIPSLPAEPVRNNTKPPVGGLLLLLQLNSARSFCLFPFRGVLIGPIIR